MHTDSPNLILDSPLFRGTEHEGPNAGLSTLFIASSDVTMSNIRGYLPTVDHVYLGAGRLSPINSDLCREVLAYRPLKWMTLEVANLSAQDLDRLRAFCEKARETASTLGGRTTFDKVLIVLTAEMRLPSGEIFSHWPEATSTFLRLEELGVNVALKIDNGKYVRVLQQNKLYINSLEVGYSTDTRLPLL